MKHLPIKTAEVLLAGYFGSNVYGTSNEHSDVDVVIVTKSKSIDMTINNVDYQILSEQDFINKLNLHQIMPLETFFLPSDKIIYEQEGYRASLNFVISTKTLRHSLSQTASNSFVKCKKKLTMEQDLDYVGLKSLYHSLRILTFGIDMAKHGRITNYSACNDLYHEIISSEPNWDKLKEKYQPIYNALSTEFRKVTTK